MSLLTRIDPTVFEDVFLSRLGGYLDYSGLKVLASHLQQNVADLAIRAIQAPQPTDSEALTMRVAMRIEKTSKFLIGAAREGDLEVLETIVAHRLFQFVSPSDICRAFERAVSNQRIEILQRLLPFTTETMVAGGFRLACKHGFLEVAQILAERDELTKDEFSRGFIAACMEGRSNIYTAFFNHPKLKWNSAKLMLFTACDSDAFTIAALLATLDTIKPFIGSGFVRACCNGSLRVVEYFQQCGFIPLHELRQGFYMSCVYKKMIVARSIFSHVNIPEMSYITRSHSPNRVIAQLKSELPKQQKILLLAYNASSWLRERL